MGILASNALVTGVPGIGVYNGILRNNVIMYWGIGVFAVLVASWLLGGGGLSSAWWVLVGVEVSAGLDVPLNVSFPCQPGVEYVSCTAVAR